MLTDDLGSRSCVAATLPTLFLKASTSGLEIRVSNAGWSMDSKVTGDVTFDIEKYQQRVTMSAISSMMLGIVMQPGELAPLLDAMDKAAFVKITVGKSKSMTVSLNGSTKVINDFRTCSSVHGYGDLGGKAIVGANPFL